MGFEHRRSPRRAMDQQVAILKADGTLICECVLADVSQDGARLKLAPAAGAAPPTIEHQFILSLSRRGNVFRNCELVWHNNDEVGLRFIKPNANA